MERVDFFEGHAWLDWWANVSTCLGSVEVMITARVDDHEWDVRGRLARHDDVDAFTFLCSLDPVFRLRLYGDDTLTVTTHREQQPDRFTLTRYPGPAARSISLEHKV